MHVVSRRGSKHGSFSCFGLGVKCWSTDAGGEGCVMVEPFWECTWYNNWGWTRSCVLLHLYHGLRHERQGWDRVVHPWH